MVFIALYLVLLSWVPDWEGDPTDCRSPQDSISFLVTVLSLGEVRNRLWRSKKLILVVLQLVLKHVCHLIANSCYFTYEIVTCQFN